jgi:hypothetical protein
MKSTWHHPLWAVSRTMAFLSRHATSRVWPRADSLTNKTITRLTLVCTYTNTNNRPTDPQGPTTTNLTWRPLGLWSFWLNSAPASSLVTSQSYGNFFHRSVVSDELWFRRQVVRKCSIIISPYQQHHSAWGRLRLSGAGLTGVYLV